MRSVTAVRTRHGFIMTSRSYSNTRSSLIFVRRPSMQIAVLSHTGAVGPFPAEIQADGESVLHARCGPPVPDGVLRPDAATVIETTERGRHEFEPLIIELHEAGRRQRVLLRGVLELDVAPGDDDVQRLVALSAARRRYPPGAASPPKSLASTRIRVPEPSSVSATRMSGWSMTMSPAIVSGIAMVFAG